MRTEYRLNSDVVGIKLTEEEHETLVTLIDNFREDKNKQSIELIKREFGVNYNDIIAYGKSDEVDHSLLKSLIPVQSTRGLPKAIAGNFKCYATEKPTIIMHETRDTSWQCYITTIGNPEYVLLSLKKKEDEG